MLIYALKRVPCPWSDPPLPVYADADWPNLPGNGLCPTCRFIDRSLYPKPLDVVIEGITEEYLCFTLEDTGVTIWRRDFIEMISEYLSGFVLGSCFLPDGTVIDDYLTCYTSNYLVVRGNKQSRYHICPTCGSITSEVRPGPEYVLQRNLTNAKAYQDAAGHFFFTEDIALKLNLDPWDIDEQNVYVEAVSVRETPADDKILPGDSDIPNPEPSALRIT